MKVSLSYSENLHFKAKVREFEEVNLDEPESFHGTDCAPSPIEYFLVGIGGCIGSTFAYCLQLNKIRFKELGLVVDGKIKHVGPDKRLKLVNISVDILLKLEDDQNQKKVEKCKSQFLAFCPISEVVSNGVPLAVNLIDN